MKRIYKQKTMLCPFCRKELIKGESKQFENIADHVSDPNMTEHPYRDTYICLCDEALNSFWDSFGDLYTHNSKLFLTGKTYSAINSGAWECDKKSNRESKLRKYWWFKLYKTLKYKYAKIYFDIKYGKKNNPFRVNQI